MRTLTTTAAEITNFALFCEYVHNCDNGQLMGLVIEANYANDHGYFKHRSYCDNVKNTISANKPNAVGVVTILDMCICIGQELIERVVNGTFDENEIITRKMLNKQ
jgi:hypothetical protein